ncbi:MAG: hypothetical protein K0Q79_1783 [Flavipsychrobacter sp.]|jgi:hypothetical protein|nr:hypothetical protein [Flavipsychrobacter sp.]
MLQILAPLLLIICAGLALFNYFFEQNVVLKSQISGAYKINRIINETNPDEIPIFGSSRSIMGLIPDSLGANYFNYGINGAYYNVTLFFLEEECKKKKNNPWIILNLDPFGLRNGIGDIASYIHNVQNSSIKTLLDTAYKPYFNIPLLNYFGYYENFFRLYLRDKSDLKISNKGATFEKNSIPKRDFDRMVAERHDAQPLYGMDPALKQRLLNIIEQHPERYFVFVIVPYHSSCRMADYMPRLDTLCRTINSLKNAHVFNLGTMPLNDDKFFNTSHINYNGAIIFTQAFKDSLMVLNMR